MQASQQPQKAESADGNTSEAVSREQARLLRRNVRWAVAFAAAMTLLGMLIWASGAPPYPLIPAVGGLMWGGWEAKSLRRNSALSYRGV